MASRTVLLLHHVSQPPKSLNLNRLLSFPCAGNWKNDWNPSCSIKSRSFFRASRNQEGGLRRLGEKETSLGGTSPRAGSPFQATSGRRAPNFETWAPDLCFGGGLSLEGVNPSGHNNRLPIRAAQKGEGRMSFDQIELLIVKSFAILSLVITLLGVLAWELEKLRRAKTISWLFQVATQLLRKLAKKRRRAVQQACGTGAGLLARKRDY